MEILNFTEKLIKSLDILFFFKPSGFWKCLVTSMSDTLQSDTLPSIICHKRKKTAEPNIAQSLKLFDFHCMQAQGRR